jgi:TPR repeat protein
VCYLNGTGVETNKERAAELFRLSAEAGNVNGAFYLGLCYRDGTGIPQDSVKAEYWLEKAGK